MQATFGGLFQGATHRWKLNVDIAAQILTWGLEIGEERIRSLL